MALNRGSLWLEPVDCAPLAMHGWGPVLALARASGLCSVLFSQAKSPPSAKRASRGRGDGVRRREAGPPQKRASPGDAERSSAAVHSSRSPNSSSQLNGSHPKYDPVSSRPKHDPASSLPRHDPVSYYPIMPLSSRLSRDTAAPKGGAVAAAPLLWTLRN